MTQLIFGKLKGASFKSLAESAKKATLQLARTSSGEGKGGLAAIGADALGALAELTDLCTSIKKWKLRRGLHPLQSLKGGSQRVLQRLARHRGGDSDTSSDDDDDDMSDAVSAVVQRPRMKCLLRLVRRAMDEAGLAADIAEPAVRIVSGMFDALQGHFKPAIHAFIDGAAQLAHIEVPAWARATLDAVLSGDPRVIMAAMDQIAQGVIKDLVADPEMRRRVTAILRLATAILKALASSAANAAASGASARQAAGAAVSSARRMLTSGNLVRTVEDCLRELLPPSAQDAVEVLSGVLSLTAGDLSGLRKVAVRFGNFDPAKVDRVVALVRELTERLKAAQAASKGGAAKAKEVVPHSKKGLRAMFEKYDADGSGRLDFHEFTEMTKHMHLNGTSGCTIASPALSH